MNLKVRSLDWNVGLKIWKPCAQDLTIESPILGGELEGMSTEEFLHNLSYQPFYWKRFGVAFRSWCFRITTLTDEDLKNKVPKNNLGVYSIYCDKSQWSCGSGVQNFWNAINEGHLDMTYEFFEDT